MLRRIFFRVVIACIGSSQFLLSGCYSTGPLITMHVHDASSPTFSGTIIIRPDALKFGEHVKQRGGFEFGYEHYSGEGSSDIGAGQFLSLDQGTINGPQTSNNTATIDHAFAAYNHLFSFGNHFQLEPAIGLAHDKYRATAMGTALGSTQLSIADNRWRLQLSMTPRWNFNEYVGVEYRGEIGISGMNLFLVVRPTSNWALKVGYHESDETFDPSNRSSIHARFSGFAGNATFIF